jgi:CheY-like chemotaxis protein
LAKTVLVVEDDHEIRVGIRTLFEDEGYFVVTATNGYSALEQLGRMSQPGLILLDMNLPMMDGSEFLKTLRAHYKYHSIPVLQISASQSRHPMVNGALAKPFDVEALLSMAERLWGSQISA